VQHKNYKSFLNLSYHKEDFSIDASWVLLATSHGKTPSDGIGKQQLTRTSLMHPAHDQLLTAARECFKFIHNLFPGSTNSSSFQKQVGSSLLVTCRTFAKGNTIPRTCSFQHFIPVCVGKLKFKHTSMDADYC